MKKIVSLVLVVAFVLMSLTGCKNDQSVVGKDDGDLTIMKYLYSIESSDWNYLVTTANTPSAYIDSLVEYDNYGICQPCLAQSWERSEDGLVWTFKIREGVKWMTSKMQEYGEDVTAEDFVTSASYILDSKNASRLADLLFCIKGSEDFYNATLEGKDPDFSMVGVKAVDKYTLEYTLNSPLPYFLSSLTYKCFFPANKKFMDECGDSFSTDNETMLYCGEFIMSEFEPQGRTISKLNPTYWDMENMHIDELHETYNAEAANVAPEMFLRGEINYAEIPTEQLDNWLNDSQKAKMIRPARPSFYSYYYLFNFFPTFEERNVSAPNGNSYFLSQENWLKAANNENFRKSIYYAFDKMQIIKIYDPYNADAHIMNTFTPSDFVSVDGTDYTQLDTLKDLSNNVTYNKDKAIEHREKAIEELKNEGVTFPIVIYMPYNSASNIASQKVQVVSDQWESDLNTSDFEYIKVVYDPYPDNDFSNNTIRSGNFCMMDSTWMADYADPMAYTDPFTIVQNRTNFVYMAEGLSKVSDTYVEGSKEGKDGRFWYDIVYDNMVKKANEECVDLSKRYNEFAEIEKWFIEEKCLAIPYMRGGLGYVASALSPFESQYAAFGASSGRYKYQYMYEEGISTEEFYKQYDEWKIERSRRIAELSSQGKVSGVDY